MNLWSPLKPKFRSSFRDEQSLLHPSTALTTPSSENSIHNLKKLRISRPRRHQKKTELQKTA